MNLWDYLDNRAERRHVRKLAKITANRPFLWHWPDARGWIGIGVFFVTVMLLWALKEDESLRRDEWFQTVVTMIITSGFLAVVAWAYSATKQGGELADSNARITEEAATAAVAAAKATNGNGSAPSEHQGRG